MQKQQPEVFSKKGVLKTLANSTEKHMCWRLFLIMLQVCNFNRIKNRIQHRCIPVKFLITPVLKNMRTTKYCKPVCYLIKYGGRTFLTTITFENIEQTFVLYFDLIRNFQKVHISVLTLLTRKIMTAYEGYYYKRIWPAINYGFLYFTRFKFHALRFSFFSMRVFFHEHSRSQDCRGRERAFL